MSTDRSSQPHRHACRLEKNPHGLVLALALACGAAGWPATEARADVRARNSAALNVTVVVPRVMQLSMHSQPAMVQLTPEDIARGYVETPFVIQLAVHSNSREGYSLGFTNHGAFVDHAEVSGLGDHFRVGAGMTAVPRAASGRGMRSDTVELAVRLKLTALARPGSYAWPIQVAALNL